MQKVNQDVIAALVLMLVSVFLYYQTVDFMPQSAAFPRALLVLLMIFSVFIFIGGVKKTKEKKKGVEEEPEGDEDLLTFRLLKTPLITLFSVILYVILIQLIGFFPSTILFLAGFLWFMKIRAWKVYLYTVVGLNLFIYFVFVQQLNVRLPIGLFFQ